MTESAKLKVKSFKMDGVMIAMLGGYAKSKKLSEGEVVRQALNALFAGHFVERLGVPADTQNATATKILAHRDEVLGVVGGGVEDDGEAARQRPASDRRQPEDPAMSARQPFMAADASAGGASREGGPTR